MDKIKVEDNNEDIYYVRNVKKFVEDFEHPKPIFRDKTEKNGLEKKRETLSQTSFKKLNDLKKNLQESMQYRYESSSISSVEGKPISQVKEALKKSIENLSTRSSFTSPDSKSKDRNTFYRRFSLTAEKIKPFPMPKPRTSLKRKKFKSISNLAGEPIIKENPEDEEQSFKQPLASADAFSHSRDSKHFTFSFSTSSSPVNCDDISQLLKSNITNKNETFDDGNHRLSSHIDEENVYPFNDILRNTRVNLKDGQNLQNEDRTSIQSESTSSNITHNTSSELNDDQNKLDLNGNDNNDNSKNTNNTTPSLFSMSSYCSEASDVIERGSYYICQISINGNDDVYPNGNGVDKNLNGDDHVENDSDNRIKSGHNDENSNHDEKSGNKVEKNIIDMINNNDENIGNNNNVEINTKEIKDNECNIVEINTKEIKDNECNNAVEINNDGELTPIVEDDGKFSRFNIPDSSIQSPKEANEKINLKQSEIFPQTIPSTEEPSGEIAEKATKNDIASPQNGERKMSLVHNKPCLKVSPLPNTQQQKPTELHQTQQHQKIDTAEVHKPPNDQQNFAAVDITDIINQPFYTKTTTFFKSCINHLQKHEHPLKTTDLTLLFASPLAGFERVGEVFDIQFPLLDEDDHDEEKDHSTSERDQLLERGGDLQALLKDITLEDAACDEDLLKLRSMLKEGGEEVEKCMSKVQDSIEKFDNVANLILLLNKMISTKVYTALSVEKTKAIETLENKMADAKELKVALDNKHKCLLSNLKNISNQETCAFYVSILQNIMNKKFMKEFVSHKLLQLQSLLDILNAS